MKKQHYLIAVLLLIIGVGIGFFQEFLKINVNYIIDTGSTIPGFFNMDSATKKAWIEYKKQQGPIDFYHNPNTIALLYDFDLATLNKLKWGITVLFIGLFLIINTLIIKIISGIRQTTRWMLLFYGVLFALAFGIYLVGKLTGNQEKSYLVSRKIVGGLQSLVPLMIMLPAIWLNRKMNEKTNAI